jgi:NADH-quinone oxidoreductase subunit C
MTGAEIKLRLEELCKVQGLLEEVPETNPFTLKVPKEHYLAICHTLKHSEGLYFDQLACLSGVDLGPESGFMEVVVHLNSIPYAHQLALKVRLARPANPHEETEAIPSLSGIWRAADWHEREAYDLLGIRFENHPDLRRILLPADWIGFPLRKDYREQELYHGIKVIY